MSAKSSERVTLREIACPQCQHQFTWYGPRLPNYCPECGKHILVRLRGGHGVHAIYTALIRLES